jgi:hypothetical protein
MAAAIPSAWAQEEFAETEVIIEINATDGDAGFHALLDADAWQRVSIAAPGGQELFTTSVQGVLAQQGLTEIFFESAEPLCAADEDEPETPVVPLAEFLARFPPGEYRLTGTSAEAGELEGAAELTHALPAAPRIVTFDGATVTWTKGTDLGRCDDDTLVADGTIADPAEVQVTGWEVAVEPEEDEASQPLRVFSVRLPPTEQAIMSVAVPPEFLDAYVAQGITEFKVEVGAIEASGNRTFAEEVFELGG